MKAVTFSGLNFNFLHVPSSYFINTSTKYPQTQQNDANVQSHHIHVALRIISLAKYFFCRFRCHLKTRFTEFYLRLKFNLDKIQLDLYRRDKELLVDFYCKYNMCEEEIRLGLFMLYVSQYFTHGYAFNYGCCTPHKIQAPRCWEWLSVV